MRYIEIKAPAKINIGLNVVEKREDGFHNLETFFYPIYDLFDLLAFEISDSFSLQCDNEELNSLEDNLVVKAKNLLEKETSKKLNVKITLNKNIPTGAGLGGGSSDAAATLISLNEMFTLNLSHKKLLELALQLGSDVPFFLKAKPAIGKSRGEILTIKDFEIPRHILIINPRIHISTKEAFANITPRPVNIDYEKVFNSYNTFLKEKNIVINDFENFAFTKHPEIKAIKELMLTNNAEYSLMSGSGSTVYGFFKEAKDIDVVINALPQEYLFIKSLYEHSI